MRSVPTTAAAPAAASPTNGMVTFTMKQAQERQFVTLIRFVN